jgi:type IV pilus assembly protein PilM
MLNAKSFLAVDFGAATLKVAEFEVNEDGGLTLRQYSFRSLGQEGTQEAAREQATVKALQELLAEKAFRSRFVNGCAPGYNTFSKFVKLPPVDTAKVPDIIKYEAQQNVPFPLEEVVWDYQILGAAPGKELEVLLVAIKTEVVEGLFRLCEAAGLRVQLVDVSTAALCNAFRYNYADLEGCSLLLDIGAKTSNLLFFENGNVYSRGINIGANAITQDFARETKVAYDEAERLKIDYGFVSLGGAYEEPDNPQQAAISKIARQVMTRLHIQVNQTIQFYTKQQGGTAPQRLFLAGGASLMPYTAEFFSEKLGLPPEGVEYFNPLRNVQLDPSLDREELAKVAHGMGEVVGLGLRNVAHCPVELNLMPRSSLQRQEFNQKKPFLVAAVFSLILVILAFGYFNGNVAKEKERALQNLQQQLKPLQTHDQGLEKVNRELRQAQDMAEQYEIWMEERFYWASVLAQTRDVFMAVEAKTEEALKVKTGLWIETLTPVTCEATNAPAGGRPASRFSRSASRGGTGAGAPKEICTVTMRCRGKNLRDVSPTANGETAYAVQEALKQSEYFDPAGVVFSGTVAEEELTFSFELTAKLKRPIKL